MFRPTYAIAAFMGRSDETISRAILRVLLEGLVQIDCIELSAYGYAIPPIYSSGTVYQRDARTDVDDDWQDAITTAVHKYGDCEDLAAWRCAEIRVREGIYAWLDFTWEYMPDGSKRIHIFVVRADGIIEDPSLVLMGTANVATVITPKKSSNVVQLRTWLPRKAA